MQKWLLLSDQHQGNLELRVSDRCLVGCCRYWSHQHVRRCMWKAKDTGKGCPQVLGVKKESPSTWEASVNVLCVQSWNPKVNKTCHWLFITGLSLNLNNLRMMTWPLKKVLMASAYPYTDPTLLHSGWLLLVSSCFGLWLLWWQGFMNHSSLQHKYQSQKTKTLRWLLFPVL